MMMLSRISFVCATLAAIAAVACDTMPLTAPSGSALTISAGSTFVDPGGTTQITAYVVESSGTAVQNGTTVHFATNLGHVDPVDALTTNGYAVATFMAGDSSGVADIRQPPAAPVGRPRRAPTAGVAGRVLRPRQTATLCESPWAPQARRRSVSQRTQGLYPRAAGPSTL